MISIFKIFVGVALFSFSVTHTSSAQVMSVVTLDGGSQAFVQTGQLSYTVQIQFSDDVEAFEDSKFELDFAPGRFTASPTLQPTFGRPTSSPTRFVSLPPTLATPTLPPTLDVVEVVANLTNVVANLTNVTNLIDDVNVTITTVIGATLCFVNATGNATCPGGTEAGGLEVDGLYLCGAFLSSSLPL